MEPKIVLAMIVIALCILIHPIKHHKIDLHFKPLKSIADVKKQLFDVALKDDKKVAVIQPQRSGEVCVRVDRGVPSGSDGHFKSYMSFRTITDRTSDQWRLQLDCYTDSNGFRKYDEYYCCAMGSYYCQSIGQKFIITFDTGNQIKVVIGDTKQDCHTNSTHQYVKVANHNVVEFIVDPYKLNHLSKIMGDVSYTKGEILVGKIVKIEEIVED